MNFLSKFSKISPIYNIPPLSHLPLWHQFYFYFLCSLENWDNNHNVFCTKIHLLYHRYLFINLKSKLTERKRLNWIILTYASADYFFCQYQNTMLGGLYKMGNNYHKNLIKQGLDIGCSSRLNMVYVNLTK